MPGLRARIAGKEASAIGSLRAVNSANLNWMTNCEGGLGYAATLAALGAVHDGLAAPLTANVTGVDVFPTRAPTNETPIQ